MTCNQMDSMVSPLLGINQPKGAFSLEEKLDDMVERISVNSISCEEHNNQENAAHILFVLLSVVT